LTGKNRSILVLVLSVAGTLTKETLEASWHAEFKKFSEWPVTADPVEGLIVWARA